MDRHRIKRERRTVLVARSRERGLTVTASERNILLGVHLIVAAGHARRMLRTRREALVAGAMLAEINRGLETFAEGFVELGRVTRDALVAFRELREHVADLLPDRHPERSGWSAMVAQTPQAPAYRPIALRRTPSPPRNRARSRPGGKWAARRAA